MNTENSFTETWQYRMFSILIPILNILAVFGGLYLSGGSYSDLITGGAFVLCFDFIYLFYLETRKRDIIDNIFVMILTSITPALCWFVLYLRMEMLTCAVLIALLSVLSIFASVELGMFTVAGISVYCALFLPDVLVSTSIIMLLVLLICILSERCVDFGSLVVSAVLVLMSYAILIVIRNGFVLEGAFGIGNALIALVAVIILVFVYLMRFFTESESEEEEQPAMEEAEAAKKPTSHDNKVLRRELGTSAKMNEKLMEANRTVKEEMEILRQQYSELESKNNELAASIESLNARTASLDRVVEEDFGYIRDLSSRNARLSGHSHQVAKISADASELIGCDSQLGYAIGLYHEAPKFLGDSFAERLSKEYHVPQYLIRQVQHIKDKANTLPITREAGIVLLCDDIINTRNYLNRTKETISMERIVSNTIKVRKDQNVLRLAGFSNEEIQLLKLYFIDKGCPDDSAD